MKNQTWFNENFYRCSLWRNLTHPCARSPASAVIALDKSKGPFRFSRKWICSVWLTIGVGQTCKLCTQISSTLYLSVSSARSSPSTLATRCSYRGCWMAGRCAKMWRICSSRGKKISVEKVWAACILSPVWHLETNSRLFRHLVVILAGTEKPERFESQAFDGIWESR